MLTICIFSDVTMVTAHVRVGKFVLAVCLLNKVITTHFRIPLDSGDCKFLEHLSSMKLCLDAKSCQSKQAYIQGVNISYVKPSTKSPFHISVI